MRAKKSICSVIFTFCCNVVALVQCSFRFASAFCTGIWKMWILTLNFWFSSFNLGPIPQTCWIVWFNFIFLIIFSHRICSTFCSLKKICGVSAFDSIFFFLEFCILNQLSFLQVLTFTFFWVTLVLRNCYSLVLFHVKFWSFCDSVYLFVEWNYIQLVAYSWFHKNCHA